MKSEQMMLYKRVAVSTMSVKTAPSSPYKGVLTAIGGLIRMIKPLMVLLLVATAPKTANAFELECGPVGSDVALPTLSLDDLLSVLVETNNQFSALTPNPARDYQKMWQSGPTTTDDFNQVMISLCAGTNPTLIKKSSALTNGPHQLFKYQQSQSADPTAFSLAVQARDSVRAANLMGFPVPTSLPTSSPSGPPTPQPTTQPTTQPSGQPTSSPTTQPSPDPTTQPSPDPTTQPSPAPTTQPSPAPTTQPSVLPTSSPTSLPSSSPTSLPHPAPAPAPSASSAPTTQPTTRPTTRPATQPTFKPTVEPSGEPTGQPTVKPTGQPSGQPTGQPTVEPSGEPTGQPSGEPTGQPAPQPTGQPTPPPENLREQIEVLRNIINVVVGTDSPLYATRDGDVRRLQGGGGDLVATPGGLINDAVIPLIKDVKQNADAINGVVIAGGAVVALSSVALISLDQQVANKRLSSLAQQALEKLSDRPKRQKEITKYAGDPGKNFHRVTHSSPLETFGTFVRDNNDADVRSQIHNDIEKLSVKLAAKIKGAGTNEFARSAADTIVLSLLARLQIMRGTGLQVEYRNVSHVDLTILDEAVGILPSHSNASERAPTAIGAVLGGVGGLGLAGGLGAAALPIVGSGVGGLVAGGLIGVVAGDKPVDLGPAFGVLAQMLATLANPV